jgi:hypothetical protein
MGGGYGGVRRLTAVSTAAERFEVYLTDDGIDAREAGNDADVALDRSIERCVELGAPNDFSEEPGS